MGIGANRVTSSPLPRGRKAFGGASVAAGGVTITNLGVRPAVSTSATPALWDDDGIHLRTADTIADRVEITRDEHVSQAAWRSAIDDAGVGVRTILIANYSDNVSVTRDAQVSLVADPSADGDTIASLIVTSNGGQVIGVRCYADGHITIADASGSNEQVAFFAGGSFGGGTQVIFIGNSSSVPSTNPTGGGLLYVESGALKYRGSSGTVTTLGPA